MSERSELGNIIWTTSHRDEGTISATGANIIADAIMDAGYQRPRPISTAEELDALPDDSLVLASGKQLDGTFTDCWIRPIPTYISGSSGKRVWEVLVYGDHGYHNMTIADNVRFPATLLHVGGSK